MGRPGEEPSQQREQPVQRPKSKKRLGMSSWNTMAVIWAGGKSEMKGRCRGLAQGLQARPATEPQDLTYVSNVF